MQHTICCIRKTDKKDTIKTLLRRIADIVWALQIMVSLPYIYSYLPKSWFRYRTFIRIYPGSAAINPVRKIDCIPIQFTEESRSWLSARLLRQYKFVSAIFKGCWFDGPNMCTEWFGSSANNDQHDSRRVNDFDVSFFYGGGVSESDRPRISDINYSVISVYLEDQAHATLHYKETRTFTIAGVYIVSKEYVAVVFDMLQTPVDYPAEYGLSVTVQSKRYEDTNTLRSMALYVILS